MTDLRHIAQKTGRWRVLIGHTEGLGPIFRDNRPGDPLPDPGVMWGLPAESSDRTQRERLQWKIALCFTAMPDRMAREPVRFGSGGVGELWAFCGEIADAVLRDGPPRPDLP